MKNITNKDLQRMISLMGNKKPITENEKELLCVKPESFFYPL